MLSPPVRRRTNLSGVSLVLAFMQTAHRAVATKPNFGAMSPRFQRDVATSALAVDAYQDFLVRL